MPATKLHMWRGILVALLIFSPLSDAAESLKDKGLEESEETLSTSIRENPGSVSLLSRRGDVRLFLGRYSEAVEDFEKMISLDPLQDAPHWRLGIAYYFAGDFRKSARQFEKYHAYDGRDRENGVWKFFAQARGEKITPNIRSSVTGWPSHRGKMLSTLLAMATKATKTIKIAEMFRTTCKPSATPLLIASMELS